VAFSLMKKPLEVSGFSLDQLENRCNAQLHPLYAHWILSLRPEKGGGQ
jgi:hypothetical protein